MWKLIDRSVNLHGSGGDYTKYEAGFSQIEILIGHKDIWYVLIHQPHIYGKGKSKQKTFKTKSQAMSFARKFMRQNPHG